MFAFGCLLARLASPCRPARVVLAESAAPFDTSDTEEGSRGGGPHLRFPSSAPPPLVQLAAECASRRAANRPTMAAVAARLDAFQAELEARSGLGVLEPGAAMV